MRVIHYLNQFFGGLGGEEKAGTPLETRDGAIGPGKLLEQLLGAEARLVMTLICGDNYAVENQESLIAAALEKIRACKAAWFGGTIANRHPGGDRYGAGKSRRGSLSRTAVHHRQRRQRGADARGVGEDGASRGQIDAPRANRFSRRGGLYCARSDPRSVR